MLAIPLDRSPRGSRFRGSRRSSPLKGGLTSALKAGPSGNRPSRRIASGAMSGREPCIGMPMIGIGPAGGRLLVPIGAIWGTGLWSMLTAVSGSTILKEEVIDGYCALYTCII